MRGDVHGLGEKAAENDLQYFFDLEWGSGGRVWQPEEQIVVDENGPGIELDYFVGLG
jgi:hypothetical protein